MRGGHSCGGCGLLFIGVKMSKIEPYGFEVSLVYKCGKCDTLHYCSREETIFPAGILCYCGEKLKLKGIDSFDVSANFSGGGSQARKPAPEIKQEQAEIDSVLFNEVVETLVSLGYKRGEAKERVNKNITDTDTLEECLKKCIY